MKHSAKPRLDEVSHHDVNDLALWAGQLMLQHGAETHLVEETIHRLGTALGCDWLDIFVSSNSLVISTVSHGEVYTKTRRVPERPVNMCTVAGIVRRVRRVEAGELDRVSFRKELARLASEPHHYQRWHLVVCIGLACAAFCKLFGGGLPEMLITFVASSIAMFTRQSLARRHVNLYLNVGFTAFTATVFASLAPLLHWGEKPDTALAAAVLLLIPGVPFINSMQDLIKGYSVMGLARWTVGTLITVSIALGMILALSITRVVL